jgi:hypothetical protein
MTPGRAALATARSLIRKDLRLLRPMLLGLGLLQLMGLIAEGVLESPDRSWLFSVETLNARDGIAEVFESIVVALLAAFVLLPGEREARTEDFLATLPVRSKTILVVKLGVIAGLVIGNEWLDVLVTWGLALCNPDSFNQRQLTAPALLLSLGTVASVALFSAAHAFWLAFCGRLAWVILALGTLTGALAIAFHPELARFGPNALVALQHHGTTPLFPTAALALHGLGAAAGVALGLRLWLRDRKLPSVAHPRTPGGWRGMRAVMVLSGGAIFVALVVIAGRAYWAPRLESGSADEPDDDDDGEAPRPTQEQTAGRFVFTYHPRDAATVRTLARDAEIAYDRVRTWLGAPPVDRIAVDLTFVGVELEGVTLGTRVNVDLSRERSAEQRAQVIAHELVHVFTNLLSHGARPDQEGQLRFIAEGLAEHVIFDLYGDGKAGARRSGQLRSAWAKERYRIHLADLFEPSAFVTRYDERWLYDFGERWITSLVAICGRTAPASMYRRLADPALPRSLGGAALVRHLLQQDHCSYDRVEDHYENQFAAAIAELPSLPAVHTRFAGRIEHKFEFDVKVDAHGTDTHTVVLVLRNDPSTSEREFISADQSVVPGANARMSVPAPGLTGPRFQYRAGVVPRAGDGEPLFTRWRWSSALRPVTTAQR